MKPVLIDIPIPFTGITIPIASYGVMLATSFLIGIYIAARNWEMLGYDPEFLINSSIYGMIFTLIGARLFYTIQNHYDYFSLSHPSKIINVFKVWEGGLVFYGGLIGGIGGMLFYLWFKKAAILDFFDSIAPSIGLGHFFTRIGCFLNGCCYGRPTDLPWGVQFPPGSNPARHYSGHIHPTQLYESFSGIILFVLLYYMFRKRKFKGEVFFSYLLLYSVVRFTIEFFRGDAIRGVYGPLSTSQWIGVILFPLALFFLVYFSVKGKKI
jgi:phosphatidylglycerol:prolipoprotein diacylglycerol transferase